jgi:hypothetical protein
VNTAQGSPADRKILAECSDRPPIDQTDAGDYTVARQRFVLHAKMVAIVFGVQTPFLKGAGLKESVQAVPGGHDTFFAPCFQFVFASTGASGLATVFEVFQ